MIDVIQIYKSKEVFTKQTYTSENRKRGSNLEDTIDSKQGYLDNETLVLPIESINQPDVKTADLIIIQDIKEWNPCIVNENFKRSRRGVLMHENRNLFAFKQLSRPISFEIFKIRKSYKNTYELFINYSSNSMHIGIPKREDHKFCELKRNRPIRYKINGKSDFTMSKGKERTFYEFDFIIEWIGSADKIEFCELNKITKSKVIPRDDSKRIDERKILR